MRARDFITPIKKEFQDPADDPNAGFDKEFKQDSMFNQLGKILDSRGNPRPLDTVITDDGKKHKVNFQQAKMIRMLLTCLLYTSPSPRDLSTSRMPSSA